MSKCKKTDVNIRNSSNLLHFLDLVFDDYAKCRAQYRQIDLHDPREQAEIEQSVNWIDRALIIRIFRLLETYGVISDDSAIDQSVEGWQNVKLLRCFKQVFVNGTKRSFSAGSNDFSLHFEKFIMPLFEGCRRYADSVLKCSIH